MKYFNTFILSILTLLSIAQSEVPYQISGNIFNAKASTIYLSRFTTSGFEDLSQSQLTKEGNFELKGTVPAEDYYVLRIENEIVNVIIRKNSNFKVYGDGNQLTKFSNIVGSDESSNLHKFAVKLDVWNKRKDSATLIVKQDPTQGERVNVEMQKYYSEFQNEFKSFMNENQGSPALIAALGAIDATNDFASYESIVNQLVNAFPQSPSVQQIYSNYQAMKAQKDAADILAPGKPAPNFSELMLDRQTTMSLSDLRGKVVLLDFWASWCGPCRKENPNVVRLYEHYKDKGFTVMSVSLDDNLDRWKMAIEQDGLTWPYHVSDLKKWSSAAAKIYQVRGIPFTALIDEEGNIIATNLRGAQLEQALKDILGE